MDYKERMKKEYQELKERYLKLHTMIHKFHQGTLDFTPTCPIELLERQAYVMQAYLNILEQRAILEKVDLE